MATRKPKPKPTETARKSTRSAQGTSTAKSKPAAVSKAALRKAPPSKPTASGPSKQDTVLAMLREPEGTTIDAIMKVTGWQQHSIRGFFAGVVRRKLKRNLVSQKIDGSRIYRIAKSGGAS